LFFSSSSFGTVFSEQFKKLTGLISLDSALELSNGWGDLQTLHKNSLLSLNSNVLGPLDETSEVSDGLDVSSNSKVTWVLFEQRVLFAGASLGVVVTNEHCSSISYFLGHNQ